MGKKYIIEIPDDKIGDFIGSTHFLMPYMMAGHMGSHDTGLPIEPYTEPDLEQIKADWYKAGREAERVRQPDLEQVMKEAYDKCMDEAEMLAYKLYSPKIDEAYQRGLNDAWEYAKQVALSEEDGGINWEKKKKHFNTTNYGIIKSFSINEVIEKLRECMQEEDFKVGDEVINEEDVKAVTVDMDDYLLHVLDENGVVQAWPREDAVKTDRHFSEIAEVLRKMKESDNG